jgi:glycosyltransferase involved in cell wall biosynthesis
MSLNQMKTIFSKKQKIILIANSAWNVYNFRMKLIEYLANAGYDVLVLVPQDAYSPSIQKSEFCRLHHLKHLAPLGANPYKDLCFLYELYTIIRREKPTTILSFTIKPNIMGSIAANLLQAPIIPTVTGLGYSFLHKSWLNWIVRSLYKLAFRSVEKVAFHNQSDYDLLKTLKILYPGQGVVVGGSGVDTDFFSTAYLPMKQPFVFLFLGRMLYDKGLVELAEAAASIRKSDPDVQFWIAGGHQPEHPDSIDKKLLEQWINKDTIKYFGQVEDVRPLIAQAHVVVLPSYREGMPRSVLEAMSMGRPVIVTDVPGCRDAVQPGFNGWLVEPRNAVQLESSLRQAMQQDFSLLQQMGLNGRELAQTRFDLHNVQNQYLNLLHALNYLHAEAPSAPEESATVF